VAGTWVTTFARAQAAVSFPLAAPEQLPAGMMLAGIDVAQDRAVAYYAVDGVRQRIQFTQAQVECGDPTLKADTVEGVEIAGRTVQRATGTLNIGTPFVNYRWESGDICYDVFAQTGDGLDPATIDAFVAALATALLPPQGDVPASPTPAPVEPASPTHPTLALSPPYGDCQDTVTARGRNFVPGSTIAIYGGQLIGDVFGPVVDQWTVGDDGSFAVELDLARIVGECGGGSAERDASPYRLTASDWTDPKSGASAAAETFAHAVYTFMHDVPAAVIENEGLPTCGTEIQRAEDPIVGPAIGPDPLLRQCFADAVAGGQLAEFISHQPTVEGDMTALIYRSLGNGQVVIINDSTRDRFGSAAFTIMTCSGLTLEPARYEFQWNSCDGGAVLE
jgi:hypothetical protein